MRIVTDHAGHRGVGPQSRQYLLDAGLAFYRVNGVRSLVLTEAGTELYKALEELGWLPPD